MRNRGRISRRDEDLREFSERILERNYFGGDEELVQQADDSGVRSEFEFL